MTEGWWEEQERRTNSSWKLSSVAHEQSMLEHNRVIFNEVSRDQIVSNYYLLVLYMSRACSNTSSVEIPGLGHA